jgi:hypothetical protein
VTAILPAPFAAPASRIGTILLTAARGAALIGLAVVIGIVLLQVVDNPTGGSDGNGSDTTVSTDGSDGNSNGQDGTTDGTVDPSEVTVLVLNASNVDGAATAQSDALAALGYQTLMPGDAPALQDGITVACTTGFEQAAQPLADAIGQGATVDAFPTELPPAPDAPNADCIVFLGAVTTN